MKAYKGFNKTSDGKLECRDFIYEEGKTYTMSENEIQLCKNGFHACHELLQCINFYEYIKGEIEYHEVECWGRIIESEEGDGKFVCSEITIGKKVELPFFGKFDIDYCYNFCEGFATIKKGKKYNYINHKGELLSNEWFDYCWPFNNGYCIVEKDGKQNYINIDGELLCSEWFDDCCGYFNNGYGIVEKDGKYNYISIGGEFLSSEWFYDCENFNEGYGIVKKDGMLYKLRNDGVLCDYDTFEPIK